VYFMYVSKVFRLLVDIRTREQTLESGEGEEKQGKGIRRQKR
jgi:hypothetical protein